MALVLYVNVLLLGIIVVVVVVNLWVDGKSRWGQRHIFCQYDLADQELSSRKNLPFEVLFPNPPDGISDEDIQVDIIAVPGLGSNADWSWTWRDEARQINWLKDTDMLPAVVPKSRIMAYHYDSKWHSQAPKTRLQLCGEDLIRNLHSFRNAPRDRPIIFVGHSLGGNVIQHALLYADSEREFTYLPNLVTGLVFLGSPFRGSEMQRYASFAARIMFLAGSHTGIIDDLGYDSPATTDKLHSFCRLRERMCIPVSCFFELYATNYGKRISIPLPFEGIVVPETSACISGCNRFPLQTNHLKLNKFSGPRDRSFLNVSEEIFKMFDSSKQVRNHGGKFSTEFHFTVPFGRNKDFTGREHVLTQILERIHPSGEANNCQRTAIEGLGGVGKTQVALEAAFRVYNGYSKCSVFWVPAVDAASFENAYRDIGRRLKIDRIDEDDEDIKSLVKSALSRDSASNWLLVVDNADDTELLYGSKTADGSIKAPPLAQFLPTGRNGSILFTTRNRKLGQAAAYMNENQISTAKYCEIYESSDVNTISLLSKDFDDEGRYEQMKNPVTTTWLISFHHILRHDPLAADYLRFMSFLAPEGIPKCVLPPNEEMNTTEAIGTLKAYAFVSERMEPDVYDIHRLVGLSTLNWLTQNRERKPWATKVLSRLESIFPFPELENSNVWMKYLPHSQRALRFLSDADVEYSTRLNILSCTAGSLQILGKYEMAEHIYRQILELNEMVLGKEGSDTLSTQNNLAIILDNQGKHAEAELQHRQTLNLREKTLGQAHQDTLSSMNNLASSIDNQGKHAEAEQIHRHTLEKREETLGKEHPDTLSSMNNLATTLDHQGKYLEAEQMHRQTLKSMEKALGKEHPSTLASMNNLAASLSNRGKYQEAEQIYRHTLDFREKFGGKEHVHTLSAMHNLATTLDNQGRHAEAEQIHKQTLNLRGKILGLEHQDTLHSMNNLAASLDNQGKHTEAERIHRCTLETRQNIFGKEHPTTLASMNNLAATLRDQGKNTEAEQTYRQTIKIMENTLGRKHPATLASTSNLATTLDIQGQHAEAEQLHRQTLRLKEEVLGHEHPATLSSINNLANALNNQGSHMQAEQMYRRASALMEKVLGKEHPATLRCKCNLASVISHQDNQIERDQMFSQTVEGLERALGKEHPDMLLGPHGSRTMPERRRRRKYPQP
ncbi:hypothetical protein QQS21_012564 [Conoideocrella luteorostrata]|uniref:Kinesin light chain n=1 Tax=Conoideocrella luteorostrata TaxID=1105319 RepID=A0AAJ0CD95_9HYPO|nr:hypothetical protein QQS21_012564 [Conoideocrella luteorostrata]